MSLGRTFTLGSSSLKIPAIGLGTWQSEPGQVRKAVASAIKVGYRHIDAAWIYNNEVEVGQGIVDSQIPPLDETLKNLGVGYLDLYLMHWPVAFAKGKAENGKSPKVDEELTRDPMPTWRAMENLIDSGKVKSVGISNFNIARTKALLEQARIKPAVNQVELNLRCSQPELVKWSKENGILLEAYSPLGSTGAPQLEDEVVRSLPSLTLDYYILLISMILPWVYQVQAIAKAHNVGPANVLISWQVQRGIVCLPKSVTPSRIEANFKDIELTAQEVERLEARSKELRQTRTVDPSKAWGVDIFGEGSHGKKANL
ncbi:BQ2448_7460 [Microbotryum intermedium]|uniref:BQ2448_7460 protein n=1 Tax=Microbotryum intermedium TaxID=269621 RepID=A0A238FNT0_9BASI|nr:BQ2448_7460 [Microbotryum intermedium]